MPIKHTKVSAAGAPANPAKVGGPDWNADHDLSGLTTDDVATEGATNKWFTESRVRSAVLTGLSLVTSTVVASTDTVLAAIGKLQAQITSLLPGVAKTGDFKMRMAATADAGWIAGIGQTIGNTGSGATLTGADYLALFTLWWTDYSNAQLPILTSAGAGSTRGASAAADWSAGKRLTVFDMRGRFGRVAGTINGLTFVNGTAYADTLQGHKHTATVNQSATAGAPYSAFTTGPTDNANGGTTAQNFQTSIVTDGVNGTPRESKETAPVSTVMLGCFKL